MRCSVCAQENPDGAKFCLECGATMNSRCPRCNVAIPHKAKFCLECGTALAQGLASTASRRLSHPPAIDRAVDERSLEGERKTITVLFADIKGSMSHIEDLDPEAASAIVDPALAIMTEAVNRYEGHVAQSTGDGVFALFGAPIAHEDHPQRAIYAAMRMQEELRRYSDRLRVEGKAPLEIRIGINTGEVAMRHVGKDQSHTEYLPAGHAVGLAARLQSIAPTGSIALSEHTRQLVAGYFELKPLGATVIKGLSEPVNVHEVLGLGPLRTRLQRSASRGLPRFVGRDAELAQMMRALDLAKSGRGQIVAAMAEPGVGKSRLFFEFKAVAQSGCMMLEAFSISHGKATAYLPVIDLLHGYFKISATDDRQSRREKVTGRLLALDRSREDTLPYLFGLLGLVEGEDPLAGMDAQIRKRRTLDAIKRVLLRESLDQPLIVIFEDLHWIDSETQALLNLLAESIATAKILLLVSYRPDYRHEWGSKTYYTQLRLDPLGKESAHEMLSAMLGDGVELAPLKRLIIEKTEGNPFFMEETVQVMFDEGALTHNGKVKLTRSLSQLKIPPTVQAILASRIDRLPPDEKDLLQTLAVLGKEFPFALAKSVVPKSEEELNRMLFDLQLGEFIYEQPASVDVEYIFKHALTQEVAYNSVLSERRKILHERIGTAIEALFKDSLGDHLSQLAHHYRHTSNTKKAVEYLAMAAKRELTKSAYQGALDHLQSAVDLLANSPQSEERSRQELDLRIDHGLALLAVSGWHVPEVGTTYRRARELCQELALAGDPRLFSVVFGLWMHHLTRGEHRDARYFAEESRELASQLGDANLTLHALWALGCSQHFMGEMATAHDTHDGAIRKRNSECHTGLFALGQDPLMSCLYFDAVTLWILGSLAQSREREQEAETLAHKLAHPFTLGWFLTNDAMFCLLRRDYSGADARIAEAIPVCEDYGFAHRVKVVRGLQAMSLVGQGKIRVPLSAVTRSEQALSPVGHDLFLPWARGTLAEALVREGNPSAALAVLDETFELVDRIGERFFEAELHRIKGEALLMESEKEPDEAGSRQARAERSFRDAITIADSQKAQIFKLRAATSLSRLYIKNGQQDSARETLREGYNSFTEGFENADLVEARNLLLTLG